MANASFTRKAIARQSSKDDRREARKTAGIRVEVIRALLVELPLIMDRLHRAGMQETAQLMHEVVRRSGWEAAEVLPAMYKTAENNEEPTDAS